MKTSILAIYAAEAGTIARHIADVSANASFCTVDEVMDRMTKKARATMPAGATSLAMMMACPSDQPGYAPTMAKVNVGVPGIPA